MNNRLSITFKDTERTDHLVSFIESRFERLRKITSNIVRCTVVVSSPHRSHRNGNSHEVTIDLRVPGKEYLGHARSNVDEGTDLYSAINGGFNSLHKQLTARRRPSSPPPRLDIAPPAAARPVNSHAATA